MPPEETQCSQHFYAHDESIRQNKADIDKLYGLLNGLPTDVKHILESLGQLNKTIAKFDEKYVSKEHLALLMETRDDKIKLWVIGGAATTLCSAVMLSYYIVHLAK